MAVTRALQAVPEATLEADPADLVEAVRDALDATDADALAREISDVDEATGRRVRAHLSSFGSTAPADQGAEMARLGLV